MNRRVHIFQSASQASRRRAYYDRPHRAIILRAPVAASPAALVLTASAVSEVEVTFDASPSAPSASAGRSRVPPVPHAIQWLMVFLALAEYLQAHGYADEVLRLLRWLFNAP